MTHVLVKMVKKLHVKLSTTATSGQRYYVNGGKERQVAVCVTIGDASTNDMPSSCHSIAVH
jgi:hypothetical protein